MTVDFVLPRVRKAKKNPANLVTACRPCNVIKGYRVYRDLDHANAYVLQRREELRKEWDAKPIAKKGKSAPAAE